MDITIEAPRTTVEAPVSVTTGPTFNVGVEVPERPELALNVLVEPKTINVNVITEDEAEPDTDYALIYRTAKLL